VAVYNLTASGVQGLTSGTTRLFVHIASFPAIFGQGRAVPTNYYDIGLLRPLYQGASYPVIPIDSRDMHILLPILCDALGYQLFGSSLIQVTEA